jgi:hypothetical protein
MSIFKPNSPRYDGRGEPFIAYCDQCKYDKVNGKSHRRMTVWLWVMDGRVVKLTGLPLGFDLTGLPIDEAAKLMEEKGWEFQYLNEAIL